MTLNPLRARMQPHSSPPGPLPIIATVLSISILLYENLDLPARNADSVNEGFSLDQ